MAAAPVSYQVIPAGEAKVAHFGGSALSRRPRARENAPGGAPAHPLDQLPGEVELPAASRPLEVMGTPPVALQHELPDRAERLVPRQDSVSPASPAPSGSRPGGYQQSSVRRVSTSCVICQPFLPLYSSKASVPQWENVSPV